MRSKSIVAARVVLGLVFFVFGLNGFLHFIPQPPPPAAAGAFLGGLAGAGYFFPLLKTTETLAGLALLSNRFVPLALTVLAPIIVNIAFFHVFLAPGPAMVVLLLGLEIFLAWSYRDSFRGVLQARVSRPWKRLRSAAMPRLLREDEAPRAAAILARAFDDDPFFRWMLPEAGPRARWLEWLMRTMMDYEPVFAWDVNGSLAGVLGAIRPSAWPIGAGERARSYARAGIPPRPTARVVIGGLRAQKAIDAAHPKEPHWYVQVLGVDPDHQGAGGGRELLGHVLSQGGLAYLETSKPGNLGYYERFGFRVERELRTAKGAPPIWTMRTGTNAAW